MANGDIVTRVGSQDYVTLQLKSGDPATAIDLSAAIYVVLHLESEIETKCFSTADVSPKLYIIDALEGQIQLRPAASDFDSVDIYKYYVDIVDSVGSHPVPENINYEWKVIDNITCP